MLRIMIFHFGRSGSTALQYAMNNHPDILSLGEIYTSACEFEGEVIWEPQDFVRILNDYQYLGEMRKKARFCFFELKSGNFLSENCHVNRLSALEALKGEIDGVIVLRRSNILKRVVSAYIASISGVYHVGDHPDLVPAHHHQKIDLPLTELTDFATSSLPEDLVTLLDATELREKLIVDAISQTFDNIMSLNYEDDVESDVNVAIVKIFRKYKIPEMPLTVVLRKTSCGLNRDLSNFDDVSALLQGSRHAWMLR